MNPGQSKASTIMWWVGGFVVVILSGLAAFMFATKGSSEVVANLSVEETSVTPKESTSSVSTKVTTTAASVSDITNSVTDLSASITEFDAAIGELDVVDTSEATPTL